MEVIQGREKEGEMRGKGDSGRGEEGREERCVVVENKGESVKKEAKLEGNHMRHQAEARRSLCWPTIDPSIRRHFQGFEERADPGAGGQVVPQRAAHNPKGAVSLHGRDRHTTEGSLAYYTLPSVKPICFC